MSAQHFTRDNLDPSTLFEYKRRIPWVMARRIWGAFTVETSEGTIICTDGWLALDSEGNPYPIADDVFQRTYYATRLTGPEPTS